MKTKLLIVSGMLLALTGTANADSTSLYTPPILYSNSSLEVICSIVNVGEKERTVDVEVWQAGMPVYQSLSRTIPAGDSYEFRAFPLAGNGYIGTFCKFIVQGARHNYRTAICSQDFGCLAGE